MYFDIVLLALLQDLSDIKHMVNLLKIRIDIHKLYITHMEEGVDIQCSKITVRTFRKAIPQ